jgi:DNA-binding LacI/PurR family transcriptional regulator
VIQSHRTSQPITAVVTYAFNIAVRSMVTLGQAGLRCPADVSIVSCEELYAQRRDWPEMTGVSCNRYEMGRAAARMILEKVAQQGSAQASQVFRGKIVTGATVRAVDGQPSVEEKVSRRRVRR